MYVDENVTSIHIGPRQERQPGGALQDRLGGANPRKNRRRHPEQVHGRQPLFHPVEALDYARQRDLLAKGDGDYDASATSSNSSRRS